VIPPPLRSLEEKHLIQNQMFGSRQTAGQTPPPKSVPIYISWYINDYGRPWTPLDVNPRIRHVHGQIAGTGGVLLMTTDQKVSYSSPSGALVTALSVPTMPRRVPNGPQVILTARFAGAYWCLQGERWAGGGGIF
jgi:hypothetical protein